jgi:hypothetical protein
MPALGSNVPNSPPTIITSGTSIVLGGVIYLDPTAPTVALALVATAPSPPTDDAETEIIDQVGAAHTITFSISSPPYLCLNGGLGGKKTLTFNGTAGSSAVLRCQNGSWWTKALNGVSVG